MNRVFLNKVVYFYRWNGFTQICVLRGTVSWLGQGDGAGELQLWHHETSKLYIINASHAAGGYGQVCELLMFYSFTSKSPLTKSKCYYINYRFSQG